MSDWNVASNQLTLGPRRRMARSVEVDDDPLHQCHAPWRERKDTAARRRDDAARQAWHERYRQAATELLPTLANRFPWYAKTEEDRQLMAVTCSIELTTWRWAMALHRSLPGGDPRQDDAEDKHERLGIVTDRLYREDTKMGYRRQLETAYNTLKRAWVLAQAARYGFAAVYGSTGITDTVAFASNIPAGVTIDG